jgi:hypothetical protein
VVVCGLVIVVAGACGDDESEPVDVPAPTPVTEAPPDSATIDAVLSSRLRGEYPGIQDAHVGVDGGQMRLELTVGEGETPGDARALATLVAEELRTFVPQVLEGVDRVDVRIDGPDGPVHESFVLFGQLLPMG